MGLGSCDCTYSYRILAENSTGKNLRVTFKGLADEKGFIEDTINLSNGESRLIIKNVEIFPEEGCAGTSPKHCIFVADYVHGFIRDTVPSKIEWCDGKISFEKTDIQEGEFIIKYIIDDF